MYEECHNSEITDFETEPILEDPNSLVNQVKYTNSLLDL